MMMGKLQRQETFLVRAGAGFIRSAPDFSHRAVLTQEIDSSSKNRYDMNVNIAQIMIGRKERLYGQGEACSHRAS